MKIVNHCSLLQHNTFGIEVYSDVLMEFCDEAELHECLRLAGEKPLLMIGAGSNLLFLNDFHGVVLHSAISGIEILQDDGDSVLVKVGSGVVWDDFVAYSVSHGLWGAENLTAVPGEVGACAVQNIGAYGAEAKDIIDSVRAVSVSDGTVRVFSNSECRYGYRDSIFKNGLKGKYVVTYVCFRLSRKASPNLGYGGLKESVGNLGGASLENIREAVRLIRDSKLPDPKVTGNAGSFFMNPVVPESVYLKILKEYPDVPSYPAGEGLRKIPAGWLIERCGWKGRNLGPAAVHDRQALVLVNRGGATGADIRALADAVIDSVNLQFGIELRTEVNYIE